MKITWLGQAGLLIQTQGVKVMIDPYLSDSVEKINPKSKKTKNKTNVADYCRVKI